MSTEHTPGPWECSRMRLGPREKDRRCGFVVNGPDTNPADLPTRVCDLRTPRGLHGFAEGHANAKLIAAAPQLLEAAKGLMPMIDGLSGHLSAMWDPELDALEAAIAAAEGSDQ